MLLGEARESQDNVSGLSIGLDISIMGRENTNLSF